ncbi:ATPase, T2SS/T4P/T4SS family, partial [Vibrio tapetis subsp. quintayensis]|uniref:GspE/PulE family protein n=1 Tax=Vibrio tapetis TaxID=52443 RepID=UPI0025B3C2DE
VRNFMYSKAGVLVFAGQTGSGKTTSIAAMLNEVKRKGRSINTLEDPVEFDLGVIQTSINSQGEGKADFAEYNKLLKRHDVDIGLIGEIRDHSVAMEVSRNGEAGMLMLTSVHTSSSLGTAPTLIEQMQMPPSLISAPGLMKLWMYQTLVRCLCPHCQLTLDEAKKQFSSEQLNRFDKWHSSYPDINLDKLRFHSEKGCDKCIQGESSRTALVELIVLDDDDREFILKRDYLGWGKHLKEKGFKSVIDHANLKIERGEIDLFTAAERVDGLFPRETSTIYRDMWGET